jgi:ABC-type uncharacterized transport system fused permease/ATPase subunit
MTKEIKIKKIQKNVQEIRKEFQKQTANLILNGFSFVAALAWNEAVKSLFEFIFPKKGELVGKFTYAILATFLVVLVSRNLRKLTEEDLEENKEN